MAFYRAAIGGGGGGGGTSIEYVGEFSVTSGSAATSVNLKTGTYARSDYAELTADNFIVIPKRGTSNLTSETPNRYATNNSLYHTAKGTMGYKNHEYTASTGVLKFYGGVTIISGTYPSYNSTTYTERQTVNMSPKWKVYVVKPGISTFES